MSITVLDEEERPCPKWQSPTAGFGDALTRDDVEH